MKGTDNYYVSERITNIKELEGYIEASHLIILSLVKRIEDGNVSEISDVKEVLLEIDEILKKAYRFEFCIERRKSVSKIWIIQTIQALAMLILGISVLVR